MMGPEVGMPSMQNYYKNLDEINGYEAQLAGLSKKKRNLEDELDKLEYAKQSVQRLKRRKAVQAELDEISKHVQ